MSALALEQLDTEIKVMYVFMYVLVKKETSPFQLFSYFKDLLKVYPSHSFMAY